MPGPTIGDPVRIVSSSEWQSLISSVDQLDASIQELQSVLQSFIPGSPGSNLDSFGRNRVSMPYTLFDSQLTLSSGSLFWHSVTTGAGSGLHVPASAWYRLRVPGGINTVKRLGYGDALNGLFLEQDKNGLWLVKRSNASGVVVNTRAHQSTWTLDKMDGSGRSGYNLLPSKVQIFTFDMEWLGVGGIRFGFVIDRAIWYCHEFNHANLAEAVYMATANLPLRFEIENTTTGDKFVRQTKRYIRYQPRKSQQPTVTTLLGTYDGGAVNADLYQICSAVESEGGVQESNLVFSTPPELALRTVTNTVLPVRSIRVNKNFPSAGSLINRETVVPFACDIYSEDALISWWFVLNGTLTNPSWVAFDTTHSGVDYDASATAIAGGTRIGPSGFAVGTQQSRAAESEQFGGDVALNSSYAGDVDGDILTLCAVRMTNTSSDVGASIAWKELY